MNNDCLDIDPQRKDGLFMKILEEVDIRLPLGLMVAQVEEESKVVRG